MICGLLSHTSGHVKVGGYDVVTDYRKARNLIGLVPQEVMLEPFETVHNTVRFSRGLFGHPTLEHNMETLYWIPEILEKGADWFSSQGRNGRSGLRSYSVSGRVSKPGVYLAPAGISRNRDWKEMFVHIPLLGELLFRLNYNPRRFSERTQVQAQYAGHRR